MFQHLFPFSYYCFHRWAKAIPFPALPGQPYQLLALDTSTQDLQHVIPMTCLSDIPGSKAFEPGFCDSSANRQPIVGLLRLHSQVCQVHLTDLSSWRTTRRFVLSFWVWKAHYIYMKRTGGLMCDLLLPLLVGSCVPRSLLVCSGLLQFLPLRK